MQFYRGVNCHTFWDNLLFYVLFVRPTSVHVAGGSTISAAGVGLVPVVLPGYPTIHSLAPAYWTPTDRKNTNLLITTKLYSYFHGASHKALSPCTFCNYQGHNFFVKTMSKTILTTSTFRSSRRIKHTLQVHIAFFH